MSFTSSVYDSDSDISTNGTLVIAHNLGSATSVTHNGVTFVGSVTPVLGTATFSTDYYTGGAIGSLSEADANAMLDTLDFVGGVGSSLTTLGSLTIGATYEIQLFYSSGPSHDVGYATPSGDASEQYEINVSVTSTTPQVVTGTFTADQALQDIHSAVAGGQNLQINAYQLRLIPEPSSAALFGLAGIGLVLRRRR